MSSISSKEVLFFQRIMSHPYSEMVRWEHGKKEEEMSQCLQIIWKWLILNSTCFKDNLVNHFIQLTFFNDCGGQPTLKIPENLTILRKEYSQLQRITAKPLSWGFHPKWKFFPFCLSSYPQERFLLAPFIFLSHRNHMLLTSLWISCFSRGPSLAWLPAACRGDWDQVIENTDVTAAEMAGRTDTS